MKIHELLDKLKERFPEDIMESYDNTGIQVLFHNDEIKKIYICLDADTVTLSDAAGRGCNLIISHHPLIFKPIKKLTTSEARSRIIMKMISAGISLYSMHTNIDRIMFKALAEFLGFKDSKPLLKGTETVTGETGFGSYIELESPVLLKILLSDMKKKLNTDFLIYSGEENRIIRSIAFLNGSGGSSLEQIVISVAPDCILTGDVNYHHMKYALESGIPVIDAGHYATEIIFKKLLAESVKDVLNNELIDIIISDAEKNPFKVYS